MMKKYQIIILVAFIVLIVISKFALNRLETDQTREQRAQDSQAVVASAYQYAEEKQTEFAESTFDAATDKPMTEAELYAFALSNLPSSLEGTSLDGGFRLDENGRLIVEPQVVRVFEYFMTTLGEEDLDTIVARVRALIDAALPDSAKADGHLLLAKYLDYRDRQGQLLESAGGQGGTLTEMREVFNQLQQVRRDVFGNDDADSLFASEEAYTQFNLNTMEVNQSTEGQTELERLETIRALSEDLPDDRRESVQAQLVERELSIRTRQLEESGASADELWQMRSELLGDEAATSLAALDEERNAWDQRVNDFNADYRAQTSGITDPAQKEATMQSLLSSHGFTEPEQKRVRAILGLN